MTAIKGVTAACVDKPELVLILLVQKTTVVKKWKYGSIRGVAGEIMQSSLLPGLPSVLPRLLLFKLAKSKLV